MANFKTHFTVAAVSGALLGGFGWRYGLWSFEAALPMAAMTTLGGVIPDIDADQSRSVKVIFTIMAVVALIGVVTLLQPHLTIAALSGAGIATFFAVRYPLSALFKRFSVHRGIWHSLLASLLAAALVAVVSYQLFIQTPEHSWYLGVAILVGALIHLLLDEICSIDLEGTRLKRSFGTALKFYDYGRPVTALLMSVVIVSLGPWLPPLAALQRMIGDMRALWH
ncbi:metal-dependent hydrolase [Kushneria aurantia]|uniref:Metal-dependent hydrolase n=1 Tax=Kushneria aurantia TaxID=504092 RepID=A0ABV6FZ10_9GAMM|nr:metal-dependent hydrolase [Kushneria aurantia]